MQRKQDVGDRREGIYLDNWTTRSSFLHVPGYVMAVPSWE